MNHLKYLIAILIIQSCSPKEASKETLDAWKQEIVDTEKQFSDMSVEKGQYEAFLAFADDEAVLKRGRRVIEGSEAMRSWLSENSPGDNTTLTWKPDFVDVSKSGDLGYTYGEYLFVVTDSLGNESESRGIFHTVWKRQADGKWKFVYD